MTLAELRQEVKSRLNGPGYRFLSDTRLDNFINQARAELDGMYLWPYREKFATGVAPLAITDLGLIEAVVNTSQQSYPLTRYDYRSLLEMYGDLSLAGLPTYYYVATPSGTPEVATYPTSTNTIGVQYWKVTDDLALDADTPAAPTRFHGLLADMATQIALRAQRLYSEAAAYNDPIASQSMRMLEELQPGQSDGPEAYMPFDPAGSVDS